MSPLFHGTTSLPNGGIILGSYGLGFEGFRALGFEGFGFRGFRGLGFQGFRCLRVWDWRVVSGYSENNTASFQSLTPLHPKR